jgi:hypothetical protein
VRDDRLLRTEPATNNVYEYGVNKNVENLPQLRKRMSEIIENYHDVQQDVLETFIDRGQLRKLAEPTILPSSRRIPGLKLDHPRQLAVMHSLVRFANVAANGRFTTADLYQPALDALGITESRYSLASFRYDLSKLRAKGLVEKVPRSRRYQLVGEGYSICVVFLKLFEKSMHHSPQAYWRRSVETAPCRKKALHSRIASTNTSATVSTRYSKLSASASPPELRKREQNSRSGPYNGKQRGQTSAVAVGHGAVS